MSRHPSDKKKIDLFGENLWPWVSAAVIFVPAIAACVGTFLIAPKSVGEGISAFCLIFFGLMSLIALAVMLSSEEGW